MKRILVRLNLVSVKKHIIAQHREQINKRRKKIFTVWYEVKSERKDKEGKEKKTRQKIESL